MIGQGVDDVILVEFCGVKNAVIMRWEGLNDNTSFLAGADNSWAEDIIGVETYQQARFGKSARPDQVAAIASPVDIGVQGEDDIVGCG